MRRRRQLVVDLEHRGDRQQHEEREVDQRMHDPGGGLPEKGLHVDAGAEVAEAALGVAPVGGPVVGGTALPVPDPVGEQHGPVDDEEWDDALADERPPEDPIPSEKQSESKTPPSTTA